MWTQKEIEILKEKYDNIYIEDLEQLLPNRTKNAIFIKANKLGLKRKNVDSRTRRKYTFWYDFFNNIDSPNKAYYLGWAFSDGNVSGTSYRLRLNKKDIDILKKFSIAIKSNYPIYDRDKGENKEIVLSHRKIVADLYKLGCVPNKTFCLTFPNIDSYYIWDFIKGLFDGDGSYICTEKTKKIGFVSASKDFIHELSNILRNYNINQTPYYSKHGNYYRIEITSKKGIKEFLNYILKTQSDFLDRKYKKMCELQKYINS